MEDCDTHLMNLLSDILSIQLVDLVNLTMEDFLPLNLYILCYGQDDLGDT